MLESLRRLITLNCEDTHQNGLRVAGTLCWSWIWNLLLEGDFRSPCFTRASGLSLSLLWPWNALPLGTNNCLIFPLGVLLLLNVHLWQTSLFCTARAFGCCADGFPGDLLAPGCSDSPRMLAWSPWKQWAWFPNPHSLSFTHGSVFTLVNISAPDSAVKDAHSNKLAQIDATLSSSVCVVVYCCTCCGYVSNLETCCS